MADTVPTGARAEVAKLYKEQLAAPLAAVNSETDKLLPMLAALSDADKLAVNKAANAIIDGRTGEEAFVPRKPVTKMARLSRNAQALEGFLKSVDGEKEGPLTRLEKSAGGHRYEMFDQFAETARVVAQAVEQAIPQNAELVATAKAVAQNAGAVEDGIKGRDNDVLFLRTMRELKTGEPTAERTPITAENTAKEVIEQQLVHPMHSMTRTAEKLQGELAKLSDEDMKRLQHMTGSYREQSTLPDMNLAQDNNIPASLAAFTDQANGLRSLLTKVAAGGKTEELNATESAAADRGAWATTNDLRMPVRALAALASAGNRTVAGEKFTAENRSEEGKFDTIIALAGKLSSKTWEMQKAITAPGVEDKLKTAIAEYRARPVEQVPAQMTEATAEPLVQQQQRGVA